MGSTCSRQGYSCIEKRLWLWGWSISCHPSSPPLFRGWPLLPFLWLASSLVRDFIYIFFSQMACMCLCVTQIPVKVLNVVWNAKRGWVTICCMASDIDPSSFLDSIVTRATNPSTVLHAMSSHHWAHREHTSNMRCPLVFPVVLVSIVWKVMNERCISKRHLVHLNVYGESWFCSVLTNWVNEHATN